MIEARFCTQKKINSSFFFMKDQFVLNCTMTTYGMNFEVKVINGIFAWVKLLFFP